MWAPEQPGGCPKAMAPPLTFTISGLRPRSSTTAHHQVGSHLGNVFCRFAHGIDAIHILRFAIWIPPAGGRVTRGQVAKGERRLGIAQRVRSAL
jgi:hypothetical protein